MRKASFSQAVPDGLRRRTTAATRASRYHAGPAFRRVYRASRPECPAPWPFLMNTRAFLPPSDIEDRDAVARFSAPMPAFTPQVGPSSTGSHVPCRRRRRKAITTAPTPAVNVFFLSAQRHINRMEYSPASRDEFDDDDFAAISSPRRPGKISFSSYWPAYRPRISIKNSRQSVAQPDISAPLSLSLSRRQEGRQRIGEPSFARDRAPTGFADK